jgi:hypothetical protein
MVLQMNQNALFTQDYTIDLDINLRAGGYLRFIRRLLIAPYSLIRQPLASLAGLVILPGAGQAYKDILDKADLEKRGMTLTTVISNQIIGKDTSYGIFKQNMSNQDSIKDKKVVVLILGNGFQTMDYIDITYQMSLRKDNDPKFPDIYGIDHPVRNRFWDLDKEKTIRNACAHIKRLLDTGYTPENITFNGLSLGGAIAAAALDRFNGYTLADGRIVGKDAKFGTYIGEKTLTRTGDFILGEVEQNAKEQTERTIWQKIASWIIKQIINFLKWDFDTVELWDKLPVNEKFAFNMLEDPVVRGIAGLATEVATKEKGKVFVVSHEKPTAQVCLKNGTCMKVDFGYGHDTSLYKNSYVDFVQAVANQKSSDSLGIA